jgi:hypothetical protein
MRMPSEETQFKGKGVGTLHGARPIGAKFPVEIEQVLRSLPLPPGQTLSDYVRAAVVEKLQRDGHISEG